MAISLTVLNTVFAKNVNMSSDKLIPGLDADFLDGASLDTDGTMAANSDAKVPSQKAAKTYIDNLAGDGRTTETVKENADTVSALDSAVAKLTGTQAIAGIKTFSDGLDVGCNGTALTFKIVPWYVTSQVGVFAAHGLTASKIKGILPVLSDATTQRVDRWSHTDTDCYCRFQYTYTGGGYFIVFYEP